MGVRISGFKIYNEYWNLRNKIDYYGVSFSFML